MGKTKGFIEVSGVMEVNFTVKLPMETQHKGMCCDDPAVEVAMEAISQSADIFLWGVDEVPAHVYAEVCEQDVTIEEDNRTGA